MTTFLSIWRGDVGRRPKRCAHKPAEEIAAIVAGEYGLTVDGLRSRSRRRAIAWPRQHAMYALYQTGRYSLPTIGEFFGGLDHTTVLHGVRRHAERMRAA